MDERLPPGPSSPVMTTLSWLRRPLPFLEEARARYGETFTMRIAGMPPFVVFSNPEHVKEVFTDDGTALQAGRLNAFLRPFLGDHSTLMLDGKEHLRHRRLLLPPFHGERMQRYGQTMLDVSDTCIDAWPLHEPFSIHERMQWITLRVIIRTILGIDDPVRFERVADMMTDLLNVAAWPPLLLPFMQKDLGPFSPWGRFLRKSRAADDVLYEEIRTRRARGTAGKDDVLSLLIDARDEAGEPMTEVELRDELVTLLVAGHETSATALAWTLRFLIAQPHLWARLESELRDASDGAALPPPERIAKLELLDAVVREGLRLQPVIPIVGRYLDRPMRLGGWDLPAGVAVICSIYLAQRRPEAFPNPTKFDADRFLGKKPTPYELFPFGGGIRRCIGMAFALYEMKMVLAKIVTRTKLSLLEPDAVRVVRRSITLMPSEGLRVRLEKRARAA
jgi:cytochrome P450